MSPIWGGHRWDIGDILGTSTEAPMLWFILGAWFVISCVAAPWLGRSIRTFGE
jgi:hypothetical protein